ncbi:MAG: hypothetical protein ABH803_01615 [Candidatus Micrarchaeota archaeon]
MTFFCKNCRHIFEASDDQTTCPRCSSKHTEKKEEKSVSNTGVQKFYTTKGIVYGDTKNAWKSYHASRDVKQCAKCGGIDFKNDYKHREKICNSCGEIYSLPRSGG